MTSATRCRSNSELENKGEIGDLKQAIAWERSMCGPCCLRIEAAVSISRRAAAANSSVSQSVKQGARPTDRPTDRPTIRPTACLPARQSVSQSGVHGRRSSKFPQGEIFKERAPRRLDDSLLVVNQQRSPIHLIASGTEGRRVVPTSRVAGR